MTSNKDRIRNAVLSVLNARHGSWTAFHDLRVSTDAILGENAWRGTLNRVIYELVRDNEIERTTIRTVDQPGITICSTLYRIPEPEGTPDLFRRIEEYDE